MSCQDDQHQVTKGLMEKYNLDDQIFGQQCFMPEETGAIYVNY